MADNWWDSDKVADTGSDDFWAADAIASSTPPKEPGTLDQIGSYLSSALESVGQFGSDLATRAEANLPVLDPRTGKLGPKEKPINSVLTNAPMPEFNAAEANRMSLKSYVEEQDRMARSGQVMRATPEVKLTDAQRYAEANPIKASLKSGAATALAGTFNAPAVALQSVNEMVGNVGRGLGADIPVTRVPNMPLVDGLMKMGGEYTSQLQRRAPGEAWDNGEFGNWMLTQLGGNSMSMMQSLGALFVPGAQATLLSSMGAQAAGTSYAQGDSGISSALKGVVEAGSEMLPLKAAEKIKDVVGAIPLSARSGALEMAGRKLLAGGAAITTNSLVGAIEESVAQIGGNALDVLVDGQTKSLFDEVDRAAIVGAAANTTLAAPAILETMKGAGQGAPRSNFLADQAQQDAQDAWARYAVAPAVPASVQMAQQSQAAQADSDQAMQAISTASNVDDAIAAATQAVGSKQRAVNLDNDALLSQAMEQAEIAASELAMVPQAPIADPVQSVVDAPVAPSVIPQTEPVGATVWTGRRGNGYATEADAARAQAERTKTRPMFDWTIQPNAEGRYVLAGVKRDTQEALPEPLPALPAEVMAEESPGVAGRKLEESPASWVIRNKATREVVMETTQRSVAEKVNTDKYEALPVQDHLASLSESPATVLAPAVSEDAPQQPVRLGRNQQSLAEGGKPFATRTAAAEAKKSQPTMRVVKVDGGFALADKTPAQLAAEQKTALRLSQPNTSQSGEPIPAHAAIAAAGGLQKLLASDLGVEGNPRIGNRTLYAGKGRGLTIEQATEQLIEQGYLNEGASHNDAYALIKRSLTQPQYNADGIERIAEAEFNAEFDDYLTAQQEAAEQPDFDPFADGMADGYIEDDFDSSGYTPADDQIRAEVMALIAQADAMGIDSEMLIDDAVRATTEQTEQEYYEFARNNLQQALAESSGGSRDPAPNQDGAEQQGQEAERRGRADSSQDDGAESFALDQQTPEQARREQEEAAAASRKDKAAKEAADLRALQEELRKDIAQRSEAAADSFELGGDALDNLSGQGAMFSRAAAAEVRNLVTLHNLSEENLLYADSIGGIPAPSIGITKVDSPFGGFGGITLIAPKGMIDPATGVPVFDRDAWTARFPEMNFKKVKAKVADAFYDRMKPMRDLPGGDGGFVAQMWEAIKNANTQSPDKVMQLFLRYEAARVMYAREVLGKEIKVPMRPVRALTIVGHEKGLQKYWALNKDAYLAAERSMSSTDFSKSQENIALSKQVELAAARIAESKDKPDLAAGFVSMMLTDGVLPVSTIGHLLRDFQSYGKTEVDAVKYGEAISKIVKRDDPGYLKWAQSLVQPLFEAPTITVRGREVEATLTNIVEAMTFGATEGVEKSMTYSPGKVAAVLGKKFKTLAEIQAARDQVVSQQSESEGKKATDALLEEYRTHVSQFYTGKDWRGQIDTWAANDASMEALAKAGKMTTSDGNVRISLQRMGFKDVDAKSLTLARQTIEALRNASTDYFEAKPQRAVKINEFRGAVVPKGTSPEALAILEKNGLTVEVHGKTEGAREKAVLKLANRLDKAAKDIRFSIDPSATMRAPSQPNQRQDAKAVQRVQSVVDAISEKWQNKPKVEIARSMQDPIIPKRVRDYDAELKKRGAEGEARGFIYGGKVYLVADQLRTDADVAETLFHEVMGHYGLRGAFGEALAPVLREVGDLRRKDVVAKAVSYRLLDKKKLSVPVDKATDKQIWAAMTLAHRREAAEELLAEMAQTMPTIGYVRRAIASIRSWLRENVPAFNSLKLSDSEIIEKFLLPARGFVERGGSMAGNNETAFSRATGDQTQTEAFKKWFKDSAVVNTDGKPRVVYHGTTADFTQFSKQKATDRDGRRLGMGWGKGKFYFAETGQAASSAASFAQATGRGEAQSVMPVYLSLKNPVDAADYMARVDQQAAAGKSRDAAIAAVDKALLRAGHDGIMDAETGGIAVFEPTQIKSAIGNAGQFDPANPDIRFSRTPPRQGNRFLLPGENGARALRRKTQDYFIRMRDVQDTVVKQGGFIDESTNVYDAEVLSHGRANAQLQDFAFDQVEPLMKKLVKMGVEMDEFSLYAYAKHAEERNNQIAKIDPNTPDGGSGMTNAEADSILQLVALSGDQAKFDELHADLMAITQTNRLVMLDEGLITQEEYDALDGMYENYIPLRGFEVVDEDNKPTGRGAGKGFNIRGKETVRALGRKSRAGQLVENVISDYQRTVVRAERNQVAKVFLNFVLNNQDKALWEIDATTTRKSLQRQTGLVTRSTTVDKGEDTISVKVKGREIYIKINDPLLLRAMLRSHANEASELERLITRISGLYTSLLRNTLTRYNPEFALVNSARDFGFGSVAMLDALGEKGVAKFTAHYAGATMASVRSERRTGDPVNREWDKWFEEYRAVGGITGGFYQKGVEEITGDIRSMMVEAGAKPKDWTEKVRYNKATSLAKSALRVLEFAGSVSENAARVSAYRTAREMGKTRAEAALLAKGLTTNFDRKGEYGQMINSLYVFFNAAVQGAHKTLQMLANPKVQAYMVGLSSASVALAFANAFAGGDDPDDGMTYWDKIPDYIKERNLIIMLPAGIQVEGAEEIGTKGRYLMIPMQYGLNIPHVIGYGIADHIRNMQDKTRGITLKEAGLRIASAVAGSFNPFDGSIDLTNPSSMAQAVTPSIFDPVVQMATGTNSFGRDVAPFKSPFDSKPDSYNSNVRQAGSPAEKISQWLNSATGGRSYESGGIDVSPGTIENMVRNMTGGTGMFIYDVVSLSANAIERATGNDPDLFIREIPLARRVYGETAGDVDQGLFYDRRKKIEEARAVERGAEEEGVEITDPAKNALASMAKDTGKYSKWLSDIRKEMKEIQSDKEMARGDRKIKLRELRAERDRLTAEFNKDFSEVMREAYAETPD